MRNASMLHNRRYRIDDDITEQIPGPAPRRAEAHGGTRPGPMDRHPVSLRCGAHASSWRMKCNGWNQSSGGRRPRKRLRGRSAPPPP
ncbi:hypothetical protein GCM10023167_06140 [Brevibacterium pityocampae]|uniref:Uncharacterized protein n=1 Tax=Brevibacterium pityocampae TaxID=506594 RepID=A0ABP8J4I9_9MICO